MFFVPWAPRSAMTDHSRFLPPPLAPPREGEGNPAREGTPSNTISHFSLPLSGRRSRSIDCQTLRRILSSSPHPLTGRGRGWGERLASSLATESCRARCRALSSPPTHNPIPPPLTPPREGAGDVPQTKPRRSSIFPKRSRGAHLRVRRAFHLVQTIAPGPIARDGKTA